MPRRRGLLARVSARVLMNLAGPFVMEKEVAEEHAQWWGPSLRGVLGVLSSSPGECVGSARRSPHRKERNMRPWRKQWKSANWLRSRNLTFSSR